MSDEGIHREMLVADALDKVPGAEQIFTKHGVNPREECGPAIYSMNLEDAGRDCGIDDLGALIEDLKEKLEESS